MTEPSLGWPAAPDEAPVLRRPPTISTSLPLAGESVRIGDGLSHIRQALAEMAENFAIPPEYRAHSNDRHAVRVAYHAVAVARKLGWTNDILTQLFHAALLHDIGKLAISDEILSKPGPLTADEWKIMRRHPIIGARALSGSDSVAIQMAEAVALTHHERWNGTGYPRGLKGESIPLVGRVVAICDVFDALCSCRPYKAAYPLDRAYAVVREGAGTHFDPAVVDAFFAAEEEISRAPHGHGTGALPEAEPRRRFTAPLADFAPPDQLPAPPPPARHGKVTDLSPLMREAGPTIAA